jgi:folate-dependent phosphoribosylglycinamide formyltransferase PurN
MKRTGEDSGDLPSITLLASGTGTTAETLIRATQTGVLNATVDLVISNNPRPEIFDVVPYLNGQYDAVNIKTQWIGKENYPEGATSNPIEQTDEESSAIYESALEAANGRLFIVIMAGYLRKSRGKLQEKLGADNNDAPIVSTRLFNTHPAIVPATIGYFGYGAHRRVAELRLPKSAQMLHAVSADYDTGRPYRTHEFPVPVAPENAPENVIDKFAKLIERMAQSTEKAHLPKDTNDLLKEIQEAL